MFEWVQRNWIFVVCGLVIVLALAVGVWAVKGFNDVRAEASRAAALAGEMQAIISQPANERVIEEARNYNEKLREEVTRAQRTILAANQRPPLRDDVFPSPKSVDAPYNFKIAYIRAMAQLAKDLHAGKAPTGDIVQRYVTELEEKYRKGGLLPAAQRQIPTPPKLQPIVRGGPAAAPGRMGGDRYPADRGGFRRDYEGDRGIDMEEYRARTPTAVRRPTRLTPGISPTRTARPEQTGPSPQQIEADAKQLAIYKTAKSIWTYISDDSFQVHPLAVSDEMPSPLHMWSAQVMLWIEQDVAQALRRVNEAAAKVLPEDQRWVAYLPVKHIVRLDISDYLTEGGAGEGGRRVSLAILHNFEGLSAYGARSIAYGGSGYGLFGTPDAAFTGRQGSELYDVVHFKLDVVVDPRQMLVILNELCKQNFFTPLLVQYEAVDVPTAREAGYEYGSEPAVKATIVCEVLMFREIYGSLMPQEVKDLLSGKGQQADMGRGGRWR